MLGSEIEIAGGSPRLWRTVLDAERRPYPGSHTIDGVEIVPAAALLDVLLAAASDGGPPPLTGVSLRFPLTVAGRREVQVLREAGGLRVASRALDDGHDGDRAWITHATAAVADRLGAAAPEPFVASADRAVPQDPESVRRYLASVGVPDMAFDWTIKELVRVDGRTRARVLAAAPPGAPPSWAPVLDAAFSIAPTVFPGEAVLRMVAHVEGVSVGGPPPADADIEIGADPAAGDTVHVRIADRAGGTVARLVGVRYAEPDRGRIARSPEQLVGETVWRPLPLPEAQDGRPSGRLFLVDPDPDAAEELRAGLAAVGAACTVLPDPAALGRVPAGGGESANVLLLAPASGDGVPAAAIRSTSLLVETVRRLTALGAEFPARLWCVTTGVVESASPSRLAHAPLWGAGRVAAGEHPELWGGVIDLPADRVGASAELLLRVLRSAPADEDVIALRGGTATVPRLVRPAAPPVRAPVECRPDGTYLVTGGFGALGLEVARRLAERGARHIVLAGRRGAPSAESPDGRGGERARARVDAVRALESLGAVVRTVALDIADAPRAARVLAADALGLPPIRGVVHAAGVLDDRPVMDVDEESLRRVMRPKVEGAWVLHRLFPPGSLDFLVLFSSCGHLLGLPGQAGYGAANAFLDALAAHRRAEGGGETMSLGWTSWRGMGMGAGEIVGMELEARGVTRVSAAEAFAAWDYAAARGGAHYAVLGLAAPSGGGRRPPLLRELGPSADPDPERPADGSGPVGSGDGGGAQWWADLAPEELRSRLLDDVAAQVAGEMRLPVRELDSRRPLVEQGLDSIMTVVIRRRLERRFAVGLPTTLLWNRPTVAAIAEYLADLLSAADADNGAGA
ncbi:type I polyketide synthase [Actinomadura sp. CNU-125]|uniref:type I polyketide synthase n=1 Tax=Actinomadura sp. CNU-125 TaxID=1904961 RepID=UPI0021CC9F11|nr:type I polyketide synthase [Actinomadura sp. CNU-125]